MVQVGDVYVGGMAMKARREKISSLARRQQYSPSPFTYIDSPVQVTSPIHVFASLFYSPGRFICQIHYSWHDFDGRYHSKRHDISGEVVPKHDPP